MLVYNLITYVQTGSGYQTYIHPEFGEFERYKFLSSKKELEDALNKCIEAGWVVVNATNLVNKMNLVSRSPTK